MSNATCHNALQSELAPRVGSRGFTGAIVRAASGALEVLLTWQERAHQRHSLAHLDDRMMKDMGLTPSQVEQELRKPFWKG